MFFSLGEPLPEVIHGLNGWRVQKWDLTAETAALGI